MHDIIDLSLKSISKIEGHTNLNVKVDHGKVVECRLNIVEGKRFFTQAITGKPFSIVPSTMSRICGTCSSAHSLCSTEAVEKALNVNVSEQTYRLRNLLINAGHLRDHAMHIYFFCLPDIFKKDSILDFSGKLHKWVHDGLDIKEAGNYLSTVVGGRAVHPPNSVIGGFTKIPAKEEMSSALKKLETVREKIIDVAEVFHKQKENFERETNYVAIVNKDYNFLKGYIKTSRGSLIPEEQYWQHFERVVLPYSTATAFKWESKEYMVGALARINLNKENLHRNTLRDLKPFMKNFPSDSVFKNNLAQCVEMLHQVDFSIDLLTEGLKNEKPVSVTPKKSTGIGVIEAPRGTLYYLVNIDSSGKIIDANLCIPTQQNIIHIEKDIAGYIEHLLMKKSSKKKISMEIEKMIRAYDPCMSCATHFLKINWS